MAIVLRSNTRTGFGGNRLELVCDSADDFDDLPTAAAPFNGELIPATDSMAATWDRKSFRIMKSNGTWGDPDA